LGDARKLISDGAPEVIIAGVDSFLVAETLRALSAQDRLLTESNSNGFIAGEAGAAVLLSGAKQGLRLRGIGFGAEQATIDAGKPMRADGMVNAMRDSLEEAGLTYEDISYRIADLSGEQYYFREAALAQTRLWRGKRDPEEVWHPGDGMGEVFDIITEDADGLKTRAAVSALGWLEAGTLRGLVQPLLDDPRAQVRALGVGACAVHRVDPGSQLARLLTDAPVVRHASLKLAGLLGRTDLGALSLASDDDTSQFRAAWTMVRLGDRGDALSTLWRLAGRAGPFRLSAFELAVIATEPQDVGARLRETRSMAEELAVRAAGRLGQIDMVSWLIEQMQSPQLSRLAGESFSMITGADLAFLDLDAATPEGEGPNDDPADPIVDLDPDEELPVPDVVAVTGWWRARTGRFAESPCYFLGQPACPEAYRAAFETGFQRQRRTAVLALGCSAPEQHLLSWRARQKRLTDGGHALAYWQAME
jgi:uncharacterized protein (TIGR02270 family)